MTRRINHARIQQPSPNRRIITAHRVREAVPIAVRLIANPQPPEAVALHEKSIPVMLTNKVKPKQNHAKRIAKRALKGHATSVRLKDTLLAKLPPPIHKTGSYIRKHYLEYPLVAVILLGVIAPALSEPLKNMQTNRYKLDSATSLLSDTPKSLTKDISYDTKNAAYTFTPPADEQAQPNSQSAGGVKYSATLSSDAKQGITLTDTANKLGISLTPQFDTQTAKKIDNHIVYPVTGSDAQLVYTFKGNGLKEDIVLYSSDTSEASFSYNLKLPTALKAKLLSDGSIGIYGGDSSLYGNISYGSDKDKALVDKARANSAKNTLLYVIPAPIVKAANSKSGKPTKVKASFNLKDNQLTVHAINLTGAQYPLTIDPSLALASGGDFTAGNNDSNIDFSIPNQITRAGIKSSGITFSTTGAFDGSPRIAMGVATYGGYIYVVGGTGTASNNLATTRYAQINSNGTIGTWTNGAALNIPRGSTCSVTYNGYLYAISGTDGSNAGVNTLEYTALNSDGSLAGWTTSANTIPNSYRYSSSCVATNGNIYELGGFINDTTASTIYAPLKGNGDTGAWNGTSGMNTPRNSPAAAAYNGYMYVAGGHSKTGAQVVATTDLLSSVEYAPINNDGTLGAFITAGSVLANKHYSPVVSISNGHLYVSAGCSATTTNNCSTFSTITEVADIYADGSLSAFSTTSNIVSTGRLLGGGISYNGYLYVVGGCSATFGFSVGSCGTALSDYRAGVLDPAGSNAPFISGNTLPTATAFAGTVASNGYIYTIGGCTTASSAYNSCTTSVNTVNYASIGTDGTLTWGTTTVLPEARYNVSIAAYNGYVYVVGGCFGSACAYRATSYYGQIASNGTIPSWSTATASVGLPRIAPTVANNGYIYMIGGINVATTTRTDSGVIAANGDITSWTQQGNLPTTNVFQPAVVGVNEVYVGLDNSTTGYATLGAGTIGAWSTSPVFGGPPTLGNLIYSKGYLYYVSGNTVKHVIVNADATLGSTAVTDKTFITARNIFGAVIVNDFLEVVAGCTNVTNYASATCASRTNSTEHSLINNGGNGSVGSWASTAALNTGRYFFGVAVSGGYIYVAGGATSASLSTPTDVTEYASINSNGTLGTWQTTTVLPSGRYGLDLQVVGGYIYAIGGDAGALGTINSVVYSAISGTGALTGGWQAATNLPVTLKQFASATIKGRLYITGGISAGSNSSASYYALPTSSGSLASDAGCGSTWCTGTSLPTALREIAGAAYSGYFYAIGGTDGTTASNDVQVVVINSNGSLGSWSKTTSFVGPRSNLSVTAENGYLYISNTDPNSYIAPLKAPILTGGMVGAWEPMTDVRNVAGRLIANNGTLYTVGAYPNSTTVSYVSTQSISRKARYSKLFTTDKDVTPVNMFQNSTGSNNRLSISYQQATLASPALSASLATVFTPNSPTALASTQGSYFLFNFMFDDSQNASFPDSLSSPTTLSYFKLNYHPNSTQRLHGGKTFNSGATDRSLDAP